MITNLGKAITILARAEAFEVALHCDVDAWNAPSECHSLVAKGEAKRRRLARRHAEAITRRPLRTIEKEARRRGVILDHHCRPYGRLLSSIIQRFTGEM